MRWSGSGRRRKRGLRTKLRELEEKSSVYSGSRQRASLSRGQLHSKAGMHGFNVPFILRKNQMAAFVPRYHKDVFVHKFTGESFTTLREAAPRSRSERCSGIDASRKRVRINSRPGFQSSERIRREAKEKRDDGTGPEEGKRIADTGWTARVEERSARGMPSVKYHPPPLQLGAWRVQEAILKPLEVNIVRGRGSKHEAIGSRPSADEAWPIRTQSTRGHGHIGWREAAGTSSWDGEAGGLLAWGSGDVERERARGWRPRQDWAPLASAVLLQPDSLLPLSLCRSSLARRQEKECRNRWETVVKTTIPTNWFCTKHWNL